MTKSLFTILIFSFLVVGISCDEDPATVNPQVSCQADYKNQNLQGKINGVPWEFKGGIANIDTLTDGYNHKYLANDSAISSFPCAFVVFQSHIAFGVTNSDKGYYQLGERKALDPLNSDGTAAIGFVWYDASNNPMFHIFLDPCSQ